MARLGRGGHAAFGSRFPAVPFVEPADLVGVLTAAAKVTIAEPFLRAVRGRSGGRVAYGDPMADRGLLAVVPVSVAANGDGHLAGLATYSCRGTGIYGMPMNRCAPPGN